MTVIRSIHIYVAVYVLTERISLFLRGINCMRCSSPYLVDLVTLEIEVKLDRYGWSFSWFSSCVLIVGQYLVGIPTGLFSWRRGGRAHQYRKKHIIAWNVPSSLHVRIGKATYSGRPDISSTPRQYCFSTTKGDTHLQKLRESTIPNHVQVSKPYSDVDSRLHSAYLSETHRSPINLLPT
jgi:hypothetical protein